MYTEGTSLTKWHRKKGKGLTYLPWLHGYKQRNASSASWQMSSRGTTSLLALSIKMFEGDCWTTRLLAYRRLETCARPVSKHRSSSDIAEETKTVDVLTKKANNLGKSFSSARRKNIERKGINEKLTEPTPFRSQGSKRERLDNDQHWPSRIERSSYQATLPTEDTGRNANQKSPRGSLC